MTKNVHNRGLERIVKLDGCADYLSPFYYNSIIYIHQIPHKLRALQNGGRPRIYDTNDILGFNQIACQFRSVVSA